jgi:rsbT co-antagonist protein RsbR
LLANHLAQPLTKLTDAAERVSAGEMDVVVDVRSRDELGKLASVFNQMVVHRKAARDELEARVQARTAELEAATAERERLQQEIIDAQQQALHELSSPVIPVMDGIIVLPLIGSIDTLRAQDITRGLLDGITKHRAQVVIVDITGVSTIDSGVAGYLNKTIQAARLKGVHTIITGISNAVAEAIIDLGIDWSSLDTLADLKTGLRAALASIGVQFN